MQSRRRIGGGTAVGIVMAQFLVPVQFLRSRWSVILVTSQKGISILVQFWSGQNLLEGELHESVKRSAASLHASAQQRSLVGVQKERREIAGARLGSD